MIRMFRQVGIVRVLGWLGLGLLALSMSGCFLGYFPDYNECRGTGDVQVRWVFNSFTVCPDDVEVVDVQLSDSEARVITPVGGAERSCQDREVVIPAVSCGFYQLRVRALNEFGDVTWLGEERSVRVTGGRVNPVTVNLQVAP